MKTDFMLPEVVFVTANTLTDGRNKKIVFATSNECKIGLNNPSNKTDKVSNMIEKEWLETEKDSFKLQAKINIIQNGLELWKYLSWCQTLVCDNALFKCPCCIEMWITVIARLLDILYIISVSISIFYYNIFAVKTQHDKKWSVRAFVFILMHPRNTYSGLLMYPF